MALSSSNLKRFFYSHYFLGGVRQTIGVLTPALALGGLFELYDVGATASIGAACVAIIDEPGGPRRYGTNEMLGAMLLGTLTAAVTAMATANVLVLWVLIPMLCFAFGMFTVFGRQGGLLGFACLLLMTLTMRTPMNVPEALLHTTWTFLGGLFYFSFSYAAHRLLWYRESMQALSVALFATAEYIKVRSAFYDMDTELDENWRQLVKRQAVMTEKHQAARDRVLREWPAGKARRRHLHVATMNVFTDMVALLDSMIASQTDYATLRGELPDSDIMLFSRDALYKMSRNVERIALDVARNRPTARQISVKAELRAIEYELEKYRRAGLPAEKPEVYALLVQILRRLRNGSRIITRMGGYAQPDPGMPLVDARIDEKSVGRFLSRHDFRLRMLTSNLRLDSPHCRYAIRVTVAVFAGLSLSTLLTRANANYGWLPGFSSHAYWVVLTLLVILKPGYSLTRQRNTHRLTGSLLGCALALVLFTATDNLDVYIAVLIITSILGYSFIQLSQMLSAIFNTVFVLLVFHFLSDSGLYAIGERLFDTLLACALAYLGSYILPWWEHNYMASLADAARRANREFFNAGMRYASVQRELNAAQAAAGEEGASNAVLTELERQVQEADTRWRLARQNAYTAFSNYSSAFYRMMDEPVRQQTNVPELNHLLMQHHVLASQTSASMPILATLDTVPPGIQASLDAIRHYLDDLDADAPASIETEGELATLAYPIKQMVRAAQLIRQEMRGLT